MLNYMGQGAWLMNLGKGALLQSRNPFYEIMPHWFLISGIILATIATIIASQAMISGSYTLVNEAMNLNLQHTNLVVLSACETGKGEIVNGEGVYGLSRSFQVAGAGKILMSLWKVDDQTTTQLMIAFYKNWLRLSDLQQAFGLAQKYIREKYPSPYYWGAFVLLN